MTFTDLNEEFRLLYAAGSYAQSLSRELSFTASANYMMNEITGGLKTTGHEETLEFNWTKRQLSIFGRVRNTGLDTQDQSSDYLLLEVGIRRSF